MLRQNYVNYELLLVNDGSTDNSGEYCNFLAETHTNIRVIHHKENGGVSKSRNTGIELATGSYIIFLDSDDYLLDGCLLEIEKEIQNNESPDILIGRHTGDYSHYNNDYFFNVDRNDKDALFTNIVNTDAQPNYCWQFVINRHFMTYNQLRFINAKIAEDQEFVVRLLCLMRSVVYYDKVFYWQRVRSGSLSGTRDFATSWAFLTVANEMAKFWLKQDWPEAKSKFIYSRLRYVIALFSASLIMHTREEIQKLSEGLNMKGKNMPQIQKRMREIPLYTLSAQWGAYFGLLLYRQLIIEKTIDLVRNASYSERYLFCVGEYTAATAKILLKEGYSIQGIFDNNELLRDSYLEDLRVRTPSYLSTKNKAELSEIVVIVCNETDSIYREVANQLEELGLEKEQVLHKVFNSTIPALPC